MKPRSLLNAAIGTAALLLAGCTGPCDKIESITGPQTALSPGTADFTTYVALGTSLCAGYESGGLVNRHQVRSYSAQFARQIGKTVFMDGTGTFSEPAIDGDGIPALLKIQSLSPVIINNTGRTPGVPINGFQPTAYHNLGVPGSLLLDCVDSTHYYGTAPPINRTSFVYFNIVARHRGTLMQQALGLGPTFMSVEYGVNELLGSATAGVSTAIFPPASYAALLTAAINAIHATLPATKVALFNVPAITSIPFFTTFKPYSVSLTTGQPVALIGPDGPMAAGDLVLLTAGPSLGAGNGFPVGAYNYVNPGAPGNGTPLTDSQVLNVTEQAAITGALTAMNNAVDSVATRPFIAKVDQFTLLADVAANGYTVGTQHFTTAFVSGGLFSLDGVHPNDLTYAIQANLMIDAVNAKWGCTIPHVNLHNALTTTSSRLQPARGEGEGLPYIQATEEEFRRMFPWR